MNLETTHQLCRLLSDDTRVRLLAVLSEMGLTVGELTSLFGIAQSRVSTHLGKLREAGFVSMTKSSLGSVYRVDPQIEGQEPGRLWKQIRAGLQDPLLQQDRARAQELLAARSGHPSWADSVAGRMERHYSPGRTWQGTTRGIVGLLELGEVLDVGSGDGALVELLAPRTRSITGLDRSVRVVEAARQRLGEMTNVRFVQGDMHEIPFDDDTFDTVLLLNALSYAHDAGRVLSECARVLRPGGSFVAQTLLKHPFAEQVKPFDHLNLGFEVEDLEQMMRAAGFTSIAGGVTHEERRKPYFKIISLTARR
jgi:ArsR family transcriptional regulator